MEEVKRCSRCHSSLLLEYYQKNRKGEYYKTCNTCRGITKKCTNCKKDILLSDYGMHPSTKIENKVCNGCREHSRFLSKHGDDKVKCKICDKKFKQRGLKGHMNEAHRPNFTNIFMNFIQHPTKDKKYCIYCETFICNTSLMRHLAGVHKKYFNRDVYYNEVSKLKTKDLFNKEFYKYKEYDKDSFSHISKYY